MQAWPTVLWEVAYGENEQKLVEDLGRYVACSLSRVQLSISVKIECNPAVPGGQQPQGLKNVTCALWEADYAKMFTTLEESGSQLLNHLMRCDSHADEASDHVMPPATKFSCVSKFDGKYIKFVVSQHGKCLSSELPHNSLISMFGL
jgi:hypothetical protein